MAAREVAKLREEFEDFVQQTEERMRSQQNQIEDTAFKANLHDKVRHFVVEKSDGLEKLYKDAETAKQWGGLNGKIAEVLCKELSEGTPLPWPLVAPALMPAKAAELVETEKKMNAENKAKKEEERKAKEDMAAAEPGGNAAGSAAPTGTGGGSVQDVDMEDVEEEPGEEYWQGRQSFWLGVLGGGSAFAPPWPLPESVKDSCPTCPGAQVRGNPVPGQLDTSYSTCTTG